MPQPYWIGLPRHKSLNPAAQSIEVLVVCCRLEPIARVRYNWQWVVREKVGPQIVRMMASIRSELGFCRFGSIQES
jgi:hypothetical protein